MDTYSFIRQAILGKQPVIASYRGYRREMCPHVIGTKKGRAQALFQFGGDSSSELGPPGSPQNWRCIPIDGLEDVEIIDRPWQTGGGHSKGQTCVEEIDVEVSY